MKNWHETFMKIALEISKHSTCIRKQVGAVLVRDKRIIGIGYNGVPSQNTHCNEHFNHEDTLKDNFFDEHGKFSEQNELHAESNLICYMAKEGISTNNGILFVTLSPCSSCAKMILSAGIKEVYYYELYDRNTDGLKLLQRNNIIVEKINNGELNEK